MKIKQFQQMMSMVMMLVLVAFMTTSCSKSDEDTDGLVPISKEVNFYSVTITPTIQNQKMAQGTHTVMLETTNNKKQVRFHFENFNGRMFESNGKLSENQFMPFEVSVDMILNVTSNKDGSVSFKSEKGTFKAKPKGGKPIDMSKLPEGILPPNLNGFETDKAQAEGTLKNGRLYLVLSPMILPVKIIIDSNN